MTPFLRNGDAYYVIGDSPKQYLVIGPAPDFDPENPGGEDCMYVYVRFAVDFDPNVPGTGEIIIHDKHIDDESNPLYIDFWSAAIVGTVAASADIPGSAAITIRGELVSYDGEVQEAPVGTDGVVSITLTVNPGEVAIAIRGAGNTGSFTETESADWSLMTSFDSGYFYFNDTVDPVILSLVYTVEAGHDFHGYLSIAGATLTTCAGPCASVAASPDTESADNQFAPIDYLVFGDKHHNSPLVPTAAADEEWFEPDGFLLAIDGVGTPVLADGSATLTLLQTVGTLRVYDVTGITWDASSGEGSAFISVQVSDATVFPGGSPPFLYSSAIMYPYRGTVLQSTANTPLAAFQDGESVGLAFGVKAAIAGDDSLAPWASNVGFTNADGVDSRALEDAYLDAGEDPTSDPMSIDYVALELACP